MTGGLITIISYGTKDLYLTGAPQITFFKMVYRRHTNFSMESIKIEFLDKLDMGGEVEVTIPPIGDLIHKMYLEIIVPSFFIKREDIGLTTNIGVDNSYLDDFNSIKKFMIINAQGYRIAIENFNAENISAYDMIISILNIFTEAFITNQSITGDIDITISDYTRIVENTITNRKIRRIDSNIKTYVSEILDRYNSDRAAINHETTGVSKNEIMQTVERYITNSIEIQKYFFEQYRDNLEENIARQQGRLKFAWVNKLGHAIIDFIEVYIGGEKIDKHYGQWIDVFYELTGNKDMEKVYMTMIGNVPSMYNFNFIEKPEYKLTIPMQFWMNRYNGLSLPLLSMQHTQLIFKIKLRNMEHCAYVEKVDEFDILSLNDIWRDKGTTLKCSLLIDYIFLDTLERRKFAQSAHEYLVELVQTVKGQNIDNVDYQIRLDINHPTKEIIWVAQKTAYTQNDDGYTKCHWTNYSNTINSTQFTAHDEQSMDTSIEYAKLDFNGYSRIEQKIGRGNFFNYVQPVMYRKRTPSNGINVYSFSLNPDEHQPSGHCNFSKISDSTFSIKFKDSMFIYNKSDIYPHIEKGSNDDSKLATTINLFIFATHYNVLRMIGGFAGLAFTFG
jgi:hypothetical protein